MRRLVLWGGVVGIAAGFVGVAMQGCSSPSCDETETCAPSGNTDGSADGPLADRSVSQDSSPHGEGGKGNDAGDSGASDSAADADGAVPCIVGAAPSENGCILDTSGVFVATVARGGNDTTGTGTKENPYATVSHAIAQLGGATAIYVCGGSYVDQITLSGALSLYGGLTCAGHVWAYSGDAASVPVVTGSSPSFTLEVNALAAAVHVDDMAFRAPDANAADPGESSIAVWVNASTSVTFRRVTMTSGAGAIGATGVTGDDWADASAPMGANAAGSVGATAQTCPCGSTAGAGGSATATGGSPGDNGGPSIDGGTSGDGLGGIYDPVKAQCSSGDNGATAPDEVGGSGEDAGGTLSTSGWDGGGGQIGMAGGVGQAGGGGSGGRAAAISGIGGGSAGGCGGCGGGSGGGGGAGGSSIALASVASNVTLNACTLTAGAGGTGGTGGIGQAGQLGGPPGTNSFPGCQGGGGGTGGQAGGGGGGAGGYSVAIAYTGTPPTTPNGTTATPGAPGGAGLAGSGGTPLPTPGSPGIAAATLGF